MCYPLYSKNRYILEFLRLLWLVLCYFSLTRLALLLGHWGEIDANPGELPLTLLTGLLYDLSFCLYASLPLLLYLWLVPGRWWTQRWHRRLMLGVIAALALTGPVLAQGDSQLEVRVPVAIILAILVFGGLWGFWGIFFAIPLATVVQAVLKAWPRIINHDESGNDNDAPADADANT